MGLTLEDMAKIGDDFYAMHNMFGGMVRDPPTNDTLSFFLSYLLIINLTGVIVH